MSIPDILYKGSVKNVRGVKGKGPYVFEFSDRYSIFDWGEMPDHLEHKGEALAFMGWFFFGYLGKAKNWKGWEPPAAFRKSPLLAEMAEQGAPHHALGLISHDMKFLTHDRETISPSRYLAVNPVEVIAPVARQLKTKLSWDYKAYQSRPENTLVPLEVIFRFGVPTGSSLLSRTDDAEYRKTLGLSKKPETGDTFEIPVVEFSTKLEPGDRYLGYDEAREIAGLSEAEFAALKDMTSLIALRLKDCFAEIGVELWDGKFEFAFGKQDKQGARKFVLVDSIGPDELRLIYKGVHLSKEILRGVYRTTAWHGNIEKAKALAKERGEKDWKRICTEDLRSTPSFLSPAVKSKVEMVYMGLCRALSLKFCDKPVFPEAWDLDKVAASFAPKGEKVA